jgi:pimeloyl-ACP methyl ester carboxylesterase
LFFIHGWLGSWRYWVPTMDALSEEHRVYAFDMWGFGDSDKSKREYSVESYVRLLRALLDKLGISESSPVPLIGHALGATVAVSFALQYPELVDRIMAVSMPLARESINERFLSGGGSIFDRVLGRSPTAGYEAIQREANRAAPTAIQESVRSVMDLDLQSQLQDLIPPLLVLYGENDGVVAPASASDFETQGISARVLSMPQARHFPMLDQSSQFNRLLADFLSADSPLEQVQIKEEWQRRVR